MTDHSSLELKKKFVTLERQQRKIKDRYLLRAGIVSIIASGVLGILFLPYWQVKEKSQVKINSDRLVNASFIQNVLKITYPQSILTIPTQNLQTRLQEYPVFKSVRVTKTIFPPLIDVYLKERTPVATALSNNRIGFLDSKGVWLSPELYNYEQVNLHLTPIRVINFQPQHRQTWSKLYGLIQAYPMIEVKEVHWNEMGNLFLVTKNCKVILGSNSSLLNSQFATLANFFHLANSSQLVDVTHIDLINPDVPFVKRGLN